MSKTVKKFLLTNELKASIILNVITKLKVGITFNLYQLLAISIKNNYFQNFLELNLIHILWRVPKVQKDYSLIISIFV